MYTLNIEAASHPLTTEPAPIRWLYVVPLSAATTFGLLVLMFKLVYMQEAHIDDAPYPEIPPVYWESREVEPPRIKPIEKPAKVENEPAKPEPNIIEEPNVETTIPKVKHAKPDFSRNLVINVSTPIETFLVRPRYPHRALQNGTEGFVELRFDVNKKGATENIVVIRAEPEGVFEDAAIAAAERWKFQPKTEDGKPVVFRGLSKLVTFEMQKS